MVELLLQKTKAENAEEAIRIFVSKYAGPENINEKNKNDIKKIIHRLGLQNQRLESIYKIASYFKNSKKVELENIFGVGHYIRNSVRCFYFNQRVSIIDINTSRVTSRIFNISNKIDLRRNLLLMKKAEEFQPTRNYKKFNWILLDFGALVCKQKPLCLKCPVSKYCHYYEIHF